MISTAGRVLAYSLLMVRTKKLLAHLKRWCPKDRHTKQVPYQSIVSLLLLFYFIFFHFWEHQCRRVATGSTSFDTLALSFIFYMTFSFFLDILLIFSPCWASCFPFTAGLHPSRRTNSRLFQRVREKKRERDGQTCKRKKKKKKKGTTRYIHTRGEFRPAASSDMERKRDWCITVEAP